MAGKGNWLSNGLLNAIFQGTTLTGLIENASVSPLTSLYVSLHTADPGPAGTQNTSEVSYTSYARVAVVRTSSGWTTASAESVSPVGNIVFPTSTGGSTPVAAFFAIGDLITGAGDILYSGPITPNITINSGVQPQLTTASTIAEA